MSTPRLDSCVTALFLETTYKRLQTHKMITFIFGQQRLDIMGPAKRFSTPSFECKAKLINFIDSEGAIYCPVLQLLNNYTVEVGGI